MHKDNFIIANWKMNGTNDGLVNFLDELSKKIDSNTLNSNIIIAIPYTIMHSFSSNYSNHCSLSAQNVSSYAKGSYTGEISASMLKELGCKYAIVGHSERRNILNESNKDVSNKITQLSLEGIKPILCVGESLADKDNRFEFIKNQISESIPRDIQLNDICVAYEPIWAIGSGLIPSIEEIDEMSSFIFQFIQQEYKVKAKVLYGGSVAPKNAQSIINAKSVNGLLIGGASLDIASFIDIINVCNSSA